MPYQIIPIKGHYEVYVDGEFLCTADDKSEAESEIKEYYDQRSKANG